MSLLENIRDGYNPTVGIVPKPARLNDSEERKISSTALVMCSSSRIAGKMTPDFKSKLGLTPQHLA